MSNTEKKIGFFSLLALVLGTMVGTGILILPSMMVKYGYYGYLAWPAASFLCLILAMMFANLSKISKANGPAGFVKEAFGPLSGFQVSWSHWLGLVLAQGIIVHAFGNYVSPIFGDDARLMVSLIGLWSVTLLSIFFTIFSFTSLLILTILKVGVLVLLIILGLPYLSISKIGTYMPAVGLSDTGAFVGAVSFCLMSFVGLEAATLGAGSVKNPKLNVPLATILGTLVAAVLYTLSYSVVGSSFDPVVLENSGKPMYDAIVLFGGNFSGVILLVCSGLGFFASLNGMVFLKSSILKSESEAKNLPHVFSLVSRANYPYVSAIFSSLASTGILLCFHYDILNTAEVGGLAVAFISLVYLWSVAAYRNLGGNIVMWIVNFLTCLLFLSGSISTDLIPRAILIYLVSFIIHGLFVSNKNLKDAVI